MSSAHKGPGSSDEGDRPHARCGVSATNEQLLAQAEAKARRWRRKLEAMAGSDSPDEKVRIVHPYCEAADHSVVLLRARSPAPAHIPALLAEPLRSVSGVCARLGRHLR